MSSSSSTAFPVGSSVLLQNLIKGASLNGKKGIVKSQLNKNSGRQEVYVFEAQKSMSIKPKNLQYEPRDLSSLSVREMKSILSYSSSSSTNDDESDWAGLDKDELRTKVKDVIGSDDAEDGIEIASWVAKANEPKNIPPSSSMATGNNAGNSTFNSSQLRQGAERMSSMTPEDVRKQAATMKAMGPAALRAMNPQMATLSDEQINMAISQMEAVANNPSQLKMAADQMKNMDDDQLNQAMNQSPIVGGTAPTTAASAGGGGLNQTTATAVPANISKSQFQQATDQLTSMSPEQLKQQAAMLRSMPYSTLRATNPQMANMTDGQIEQSIKQLEQMAANPDMVKMAADQMKNMREEDFESMKNMIGGAFGSAPSGGPSSSSSMAAAAATSTSSSSNGTASTINNGVAPPPDLAGIDPSNMMNSLLSNPEQLNTIVKTMKSNPEMMKSVFMGQMGNKGTDAQKEKMNKAIDSFVDMDDAQLEKYLKVANSVQRVASPVVTAFGKVKDILGVSTKTLILIINVMILAWLVGLARWWVLRNGGDDDSVIGNDILTRSQEEVPEIIAHDSEF